MKVVIQKVAKSGNLALELSLSLLVSSDNRSQLGKFGISGVLIFKERKKNQLLEKE